jgi:hypothetical protein
MIVSSVDFFFSAFHRHGPMVISGLLSILPAACQMVFCLSIIMKIRLSFWRQRFYPDRAKRDTAFFHLLSPGSG